MITKQFLTREYIKKKRSVSEIAKELGCSNNKVTYWLQKHSINRRTISEAIYTKSNPTGDPFAFKKPTHAEDWLLYGLGLGLFWGEGNKANRHAVRIGNTDPALLRVFLQFLKKIFDIDQTKLRFGLQIFSDTPEHSAKAFWKQELNLHDSQFQKVIITPSKKVGNYRHKNKNGVLTIYFSNVKLRDSIVSAIEALQTTSYANVAQSVERIHGKSQ